MKKIEIVSERGQRYIDDIKRIKRVLIEKGYDATLTTAEALWNIYSENICASWMALPGDDEELFEKISYYLN